LYLYTACLQSDRDHKVIQDGPYRIVRHPGYSGLILTHLSAPLILGSWYGLIPGMMGAVTLVIRTSMEDRVLKDELEGYKAYSQKTPERLIPGVW
jgi:protein-S-isoprenylcysteine O-methyltransferase Ste14